MNADLINADLINADLSCPQVVQLGKYGIIKTSD
ncbi:hypothetical protein KKH07_01400 [Patescibacteria group bacterium]|nr:hypothetical protein [Patescibacteria group bacterium]MBU1563749.1 hypothetical protein [Patescibacteria group bacterium]